LSIPASRSRCVAAWRGSAGRASVLNSLSMTVPRKRADVIRRTALCLAAALLPVAASAQDTTGVLLLAHGGQPEWNERVKAVAKKVDAAYPAEVAFGMAARPAIQAAVDKLISRGVSEIVAVPLFISSHSSVITSTEYLLGLRHDAPADLARFAKMSHSTHAEGADHSAHVDPATPIKARVPIRMTAAFNRHAIIGEILADRAKAISRQPANE